MKGRSFITASVTLIYIVLLLPLIQHQFDFAKDTPLKGAVEFYPDIKFSINNWKDESFQKTKEKFLNQNMGFRNFLVRLNNQIYYSIFDQAKANSVVVGKDGYLFEESYIKDYTGANFVGQRRVDEVTRRLVAIDSAFRAAGKILLVVFPPGKASYYPEYIPDRYKIVNDSTNLKSYTAAIANSGIRYIDFNQFFLERKNTTLYPLYPKTGIHWSDYGAILAIDSINRYLGKEMGYRPVSVFWDDYVSKDSISNIDADIEDGMNLLFSISKPQYFYPTLQYVENGRRKPKVFTVGDSFYRNIFTREICKRLFDSPGFGYYFKEIHAPLLNGIYDISDIDVKSLLDSYEVVVLMQSEATLLNFPFDFDKIVYDRYCTKFSDSSLYNQRLAEIKNVIRNDVKWIESIKIKAKERNITIDEMLQIDAKYTLHQQENP
jgi:hypothetical protein